MSDRLTAKQEAFVQAYLRTSNAYQAYLEAYDVKPTTHRTTVDANASRLLANNKVATRLQQLQSQVTEVTESISSSKASNAEATVESIERMLLEAYEIAKGDDDRWPNPAAMTNAALGIAKVRGLIVNKSEDVTPRRNSKELLDRLRQLTPDRAAGGDSDPARGAKEGGRARKTVPTVPGHGTA